MADAAGADRGFWASPQRFRRHTNDVAYCGGVGSAAAGGVVDMTGAEYDDDYDEETYSPYVYSVEGDQINWQERCIDLEMSMQRFRDQAGKIRGLLREKVSNTIHLFILFIYLFIF